VPAPVAGTDRFQSLGWNTATISIRADMDCEAISFSRHALQRMFERAISPEEVRTGVSEWRGDC
jgi:hypothetical protein